MKFPRDIRSPWRSTTRNFQTSTRNSNRQAVIKEAQRRGLSQSLCLSPLIQRIFLTQRFYFAPYSLLHAIVVDIVQHIGNPLTDGFHLRFLHSTRRQRGCSDADAAGRERRVLVEWNRVF